ncbi:MAG: aspartate/glutamate racemase family protein [Betaproteobacteria bacterium]
MRIWHQSMTVLEDLPDYAARMTAHIRTVVRPDTEVVLHGLLPGTYPANYPGSDIGHAALFALHSLQFPLQALNAEKAGFAAFAACTLVDPLLREARDMVRIPVVAAGETCFRAAAAGGRKFGMLIFIDRMAQHYLEQVRDLGLSGNCIGIEPVGFTFKDVVNAFDNPGRVKDLFAVAARRMIAKGAQAIIPGEIPMNVLLTTSGMREVDGVPLLDSLALTLQAAEAAVDAPAPQAAGWVGDKVPRERLQQVLRFYGLDRFLK